MYVQLQESLCIHTSERVFQIQELDSIWVNLSVFLGKIHPSHLFQRIYLQKHLNRGRFRQFDILNPASLDTLTTTPLSALTVPINSF